MKKYTSFYKTNVLYLIILAWIVFFDSFSKFLILPLLLKILYRQEHQYFQSLLSVATLNLIYSSYLALSTLIAIIITPWIGSISDIFGRKKIMLVLLILSAIGYLIGITGIYIQSFMFIVLFNAFINISANSQPIAEAAIADKMLNKLRSYGFAIISGSMVMAMALGPIAGDLLSNQHISYFFNLQTPLILGAVLAIINLMILMCFFKEMPRIIVRKKVTFPQKVKALFKLKTLKFYWVTFFCLQFSWALFYQYIPLYFLNALHQTIHAVTHYLFWVSFIMGISLFFLYYLCLRFLHLSLQSTVLSACSVAFIMSVCLLLSHNMLSLYFIGMILAIAIGLYYPALVTLMSKQISAEDYGLLMGINTFLMTLAWFLSSLLVGWLANLNTHAPFILQIIAIIIAASFYINSYSTACEGQITRI